MNDIRRAELVASAAIFTMIVICVVVIVVQFFRTPHPNVILKTDQWQCAATVDGQCVEYKRR